LLGGIEETTKNITQDKQFPRRNLKQKPAEYEAEELLARW
jgi:hypothetical protein